MAIIWLLIACSFVSLGLTLVFVTRYRRPNLVPETTRKRLEGLLAGKKYREAIAEANDDPSYLGRVTSAALNEAGNGYGAMERALEEAGDAEASRILRPIEVLNVLGNIAPMMGLFGTVYGMIVAFQRLVDAGGSPDPVDLAAGISTALVTTFWGLVVAIPALAAYAVVRNKIDMITADGLLVAEQIIKPFRPSRKKKSSSSSSSDK
ncbi:MAG: MotA/TolQ/ExbB proton channel family protein [Planctomycetota bacterium]